MTTPKTPAAVAEEAAEMTSLGILRDQAARTRDEFERVTSEHLDHGGPQPDWAMWAFRLSAELGWLIKGIDGSESKEG